MDDELSPLWDWLKMLREMERDLVICENSLGRLLFAI